MDNFFTKLLGQWEVVLSAPIPFLLVLALVTGGLWFVFEKIIYAGVLNSKNGQIDLLVRQIDDYKRKLDGATPDQAKERIDALEAKVAALDKNILRQRRLTADQIQQIEEIVSKRPGEIRIISDASCYDCSVYARDFQRAFSTWTVLTGSVIGLANPAPGGLRISDPNPSDALFATVLNGLQAAGVKFEVGPHSGMYQTIEILISAPQDY